MVLLALLNGRRMLLDTYEVINKLLLLVVVLALHVTNTCGLIMMFGQPAS